ncbi:MAG: hypothetical protein CVV41_10340 [Candidatus Riflebacteria bacterium HGW-Riflebacteria-1]|jgi:hypothetical protein|nr:MAG: hypothetical protein CVV41_10340 [Candidatus Riflebacteria bacterium HGW-Riflebacteria-1]
MTTLARKYSRRQLSLPATDKRAGMAIPMVLGFIFVATILGTTLLFLSKTRGADTVRTIGRFQHQHLTQSGLSEALAIIKPMRISELIANRGVQWNFNTVQQNFGNAVGWCEVTVKTRGSSELEIVSTGCWQDRDSPLLRRSFSCVARYSETRSTESNLYLTMVKINGEWKVGNFSEELPKSDNE